ncbi:hypothetical protein C8A01DRAFT_43049 [Parachaetomium inaequale]|uniref:Uncharacterized protein n=1 Tax=Parachaetomium inaequale TaxID=2588326 RepID=A0AAN6PNL3_9PEZI|nr:hypothetical protein C8A01DRAFT_43049 [Parachaetomium inaequale]
MSSTGAEMEPQLQDSSRPSCFLLRLSPPIRRRIYLHLGVARWDGFPLLFDLDGPVDRSTQVAFRGLLLSCRLLYGEASTLLHMRGHGNNVEPSLQPLRNLTASSLASMASLKIEEAGGECCDDTRYNGSRDAGYCQKHHTTHHDRPLRSSHSTAGLMLDEWLRTADYLSSRISPRALRLSLICDLDHEEADIDMATRLKDCHIRLCRSLNAELAQLARKAVLQACRRPEPSPSSSSLRLLSLPRELRLHILEYTDLVTPWREVMWTRLDRGFPLHYGCQFRGCYHQEQIYKSSIGCFCRLRHAAFSSVCRCWAPPTPLFLICRALTADAKFLFYSLNRFVVSDSLASRHPCTAFSVFNTFQWPENNRYWELAAWREAQPPRAYPAERFAASQFLREVVPADCLSYLRRLELVFPPYNQDCWPYDGHPALQDWIETIDWVKDKMSTPGIPDRPDSREELSPAQGDQVLAGYDRILRPLACLGGKDGLAQWAYQRRQEMDVLNERAERFILGDRYERLSASEGRLEERPWRVHQWVSD